MHRRLIFRAMEIYQGIWGAAVEEVLIYNREQAQQ
jgi:hypothetical protein